MALPVLLAAFAVSTQTASAAPLFNAKTDFPTGTNPYSVTSNDFNGDGNPDLAVANRASNTVSVLLGNGSGGFGPKTDFTTDSNPLSVTSNDFNGDGNPDLAVANAFSDNVSVLLGNGSGGFGPKTDFTTGSAPTSVTSNDFNGDGSPDLAVANQFSNTVSVLLGNGSGGFGPKTDFTTGTNPFSVTSNDFNGDGRPDLAVANANSNNVSVLLGNGSGGFGPKTDFNTDTAPFSVTSNDFNGDGKPDLAVANFSSSTVSVLLDNAPTATAAPASLSFPAQAIETLSAAQTVTLSTPAAPVGYPLFVNRVRTTGADRNDFIVVVDDCTGESVPPSGSCGVSVRFAPTAAGVRGVTLEIQHNGDSSPLSVPLSGTGGDLPIGPTGPTGATGATGPTGPTGPTGAAGFGKVSVSGPAKAKKGKKATYKVKISNSGNAEATGVKLRVSGRGLSFSTSVGKIAGGKTRTVKVRLKPKKPGKVNASFKVTSENAGGKTVKKKITVRK